MLTMQPPQIQVFIPFRPALGQGPKSPNMADPKERFFRHFQAEISAIQDRIEDLATLSPIGGERQDCIDTVLAGISRLSNEVLDAADYIPSYDQRTYSQAIKALTEKLNETTGKFAPRGRFQFKQRAAKSAAPAESTSARDLRSLSSQKSSSAVQDDESDRDREAQSKSGAERDDDAIGSLPSFTKNYNEELAREGTKKGVRKPSFSDARQIAIHNHSGLHIMLPATASRATSSGSLTDLERCVVDMAVPTGPGRGGAPFLGLALRNIRSSLVVAGHVNGAVHATGLENCVLIVAARQVRIHDCHNVDVYLHCGSHPIIEDCAGMRFAPISQSYLSPASSSQDPPEVSPTPTAGGDPGTGANQWDQVDDFKWLKAGEASPNWTVLAPGDRLPDATWTHTVCGGPGIGTDDILRRVGILK